jgi:hypothetical protein
MKRTPALPSPATVIATIALVAALGGAGYAAISTSFPDGQGTFHACAKTRNGALRLVAKGVRCRKGEKPVSWAQRGPAGPAGTNGANGTNGAAGTNGTNGSKGTDGTNGTNGTTVLLRARTGGNITATNAPTAVTLTPNGNFKQVAGQDAFIYAAMTVQAPSTADCAGAVNKLTITPVLDGADLENSVVGADTGIKTRPVTFNGSAVYPILGTGAEQPHTVGMKLSDDCTGATHFVVTFLKFEVIGAGI